MSINRISAEGFSAVDRVCRRARPTRRNKCGKHNRNQLETISSNCAGDVRGKLDRCPSHHYSSRARPQMPALGCSPAASEGRRNSAAAKR